MDDQDFERRMALYRLRYSVNGIIRESNRKQNQIKRSGARMRVIFCPLISLFFAVLAWYNLSGHGDMDVGIVDAVASLAFLAMLVLGAMIDSCTRLSGRVRIETDERMTAALLDRLTHKAHIIEFMGESYRFRQRLQQQEWDVG